MNHAWIAALLPLFLSPQSDSKPGCCSADQKAKCEAACKEMKEKLKACKELAREEVQKAMEAARKAAHDGMSGAHEAMQQAHQELERALQSAKASGRWDGKKLKELQLTWPVTAYTIGQDGDLTQIDMSNKNLQELAEELEQAQGARSVDQDDDSDDEMESADEAADEASLQAMEAEEAAEHAQEEARAEHRELAPLGYASGQGESAGDGPSRGLERRVAALEKRLGVHSDGSQSSLEERVAALERLALPRSAPQVQFYKTPRAPRPGRAYALPRTSPPPAVAPPAPETPRVYVTQPGQSWSAPLAPQADVPPVPPRPAEPPPSPPGVAMRRAPDDLRREIEQRMSKMREEMNRLREEMKRLREELRREQGEAR
jgi:hypothetical protein